MRKTALLLAALSLMLAACGGGDTATCGEIADDAVDLMQDLITGVEAAAQSGDQDQLNSLLTTFESGIDGLEERQGDAGCSDSQLGDMLAERAGSLEADTEIGQSFVDELVTELESGAFFE